ERWGRLNAGSGRRPARQGGANFGRPPVVVPGNGSSMSKAKNTTLIGHIDCPGGGQVWVDGETLYVGHMRNPSGTSIYDVSDPRNPKLLCRIDLPEGWHSHKVRVADGVMIVNHERFGPNNPEFGGGL